MAKRVLGRTDRVDLPLLDLKDIEVKIDTGAFTSAIHCSHIEEIEGKLHCTFHSDVHTNFDGNKIVFDDYSKTDVRSSNGYNENRFKIKSQILIFGKTYRINLTLSIREDMKFPVLIGRQFLSKKFIVDVDLTDVSFNQIKK